MGTRASTHSRSSNRYLLHTLFCGTSNYLQVYRYLILHTLFCGTSNYLQVYRYLINTASEQVFALLALPENRLLLLALCQGESNCFILIAGSCFILCTVASTCFILSDILSNGFLLFSIMHKYWGAFYAGFLQSFIEGEKIRIFGNFLSLSAECIALSTVT
jgi:hypothetical protein